MEKGSNKKKRHGNGIQKKEKNQEGSRQQPNLSSIKAVGGKQEHWYVDR
jgi:hypothetical protein